MIEHVYPPPPCSSEPIFKKYNILRLSDIAKSQMLIVMHKFVTKQLPIAFEDVNALNVATNPHRRQVKHLKQPFSNLNYRLFTTSCLGPKLWNEIISPQFPSLRSVPASKNVIKNIIRRHVISSYHV